jgi:hypothetical protein
MSSFNAITKLITRSKKILSTSAIDKTQGSKPVDATDELIKTQLESATGGDYTLQFNISSHQTGGSSG